MYVIKLQNLRLFESSLQNMNDVMMFFLTRKTVLKISLF